MEAKPRTLEITVISGENICVDQSPVTENVYVVFRTESLNSCTTKMGKEDGSFLSWNEKFLLDMPMHARSITFEVQCQKFKGARSVGVARIAVSDFLGGSVPESSLQVLSYRLRDWEGRRNGVIHFSVRVVAPENRLGSKTKPAKAMSTVNSSRFEHEFMGFQVDQKNSKDVVIGIPVQWAYLRNI